MKHIGPVMTVMLTLALLVTLAEAMDTNAAGKCVALGTLSKDYESKAAVILAEAEAVGDTTLVEQRAREEFVDLAQNKRDDTAKRGWVVEAAKACDQF